MNSLFTFIGMVIGLVILIAALSWFILQKPFSGKKEVRAGSPLRTQKDESGKTIFVRCPVCNTPLSTTDNLVSRVFRPMDTPDQLMYVLGCPHCYPVVEPGVKRECPVCHKTVPPKGYLVARLFNRKNGKKHVLITGCSECPKHH